MQNQNDDDADFSDEVYDDTLDENFEDEFEDDEYLDEDELGAYDDFDDEDGAWEESDETEEDFIEDGFEENLGASVRKKKILNIDMSFNAMVITGAVIVGIGVLAFQVITKKPVISMDAFTSALRMSGASDGPVFGEEKNEYTSTDVESIEGSNKEETKGFLYDPDTLNSMELEDTPPMPSPIVSEDKPEESLNNIADTSLTSAPEKLKDNDVAQVQIPRPPEDVSVTDVGLIGLIDKKEPEKSAPDNLPKAEEFLKAAAEARTEKKQVVENLPEDKPQEVLPVESKTSEKAESVPMKPVQEVAQVKVETLKTTQVSGDTEEKLTIILDRLDDMELQITQIREAGNSKIEDISDSLDTLKKEIGSIGSAPVRKSPVASSKKVVPKVKSQSKKRKVPAKVKWELRAAQPGKAWVSKKGQKDMRPVVIGDSLSGIGRITAISYSGNRWVVQGTSGRILQ